MGAISVRIFSPQNLKKGKLIKKKGEVVTKREEWE